MLALLSHHLIVLARLSCQTFMAWSAGYAGGSGLRPACLIVADYPSSNGGENAIRYISIDADPIAAAMRVAVFIFLILTNRLWRPKWILLCNEFPMFIHSCLMFFRVSPN
jgi:hypothetical protein